MADQAQIAARANEFNRGLPNRRRRENATHLEIVRDDEPAIADPLSQNVCNPDLREGSWRTSLSNLWICCVGNHHHGQFFRQHAIGNQILFPQMLHGLFNDWQLMVAVEPALPESGKVLAATEHARSQKSAEKFTPVRRNVLRIHGHRPRIHHAARSLEGQIHYGSKVDVKSEGAAVLADDLPMLAKQSWIIGRKYFSGGRCGSE